MMTEKFENVNHLVLNFYPDGYSIAVKLNEFPVFTSETILETAKISYEETSLLDYIENEELPPLLVEMIDGSSKLSQYKIWHNGCLILEVRDKINISNDKFRNNRSFDIAQNSAKDFSKQNHTTPQLDAQWRSSSELKDYDCNNHLDGDASSSKLNENSFFILLKPTNLSMLNDVLNLTDSNCWSTQDKLQLESQIVLYNSPPLFLEPDASKQPPEHSSNLKLGNIYTRYKKKLPHDKLKNLHKCINYSKNKNNGSNYDKRNNVHDNSLDGLPPELTLQQFLATKRATKKTFAAGHLARFQKHLRSRYK